MEETVCPVEHQPLASTTLTKLLFSHLINLAALLHLMYIRGESLPGFQPLVFITAPLSIVLRYSIAMLYILITASQAEVSNIESYIKQHLALLLFTKAQSGPYRRRILSSPSSILWKNRQSRNKHIIQVSFTLLFVFKCLATILLHLRYRASSVRTLADGKLFELACGGLSVGVLTLLFLFRWPRDLFDYSEPSEKTAVIHSVKDPMSKVNNESTFTSIDTILALGRDVWIPPERGYNDENQWLVWQIYYDGAISFITYVCIQLCRGFPCVIFFGLVETNGCPPLSELCNAWFWLSVIIGLPIGGLASFVLSYTTQRHFVTYVVWTLLIATLLPVWMPIVFGFVFGPLVAFQDYLRIVNQATEVSVWPTNKSCPPLSNEQIGSLLGWLL